MSDEKLEYGALPLHIRFLFLLIGVSGVSAIFQAFITIGVGLEVGVHAGGLMALAVAVTIGSMRSLKKKSISSYRRALVFLAGMPIYYGYFAYTHPEIALVSRGLIYWWPLVNSIMFIVCIMVIANKPTYDFYNVKP